MTAKIWIKNYKKLSICINLGRKCICIHMRLYYIKHLVKKRRKDDSDEIQVIL